MDLSLFSGPFAPNCEFSNENDLVLFLTPREWNAKRKRRGLKPVKFE
jgi:hypothetical protein